LDSGPLSFRVSFDTARLAAEIHHQSFNILLGLIALHLAAIAFYLVVRKRNLVKPMVLGTDESFSSNSQGLVQVGKWRFVLAAAMAGLFAWAVGKGFGL
jgi:hypothetical protein